jgi:hypothetical protein
VLTSTQPGSHGSPIWSYGWRLAENTVLHQLSQANQIGRRLHARDLAQPGAAYAQVPEPAPAVWLGVGMGSRSSLILGMSLSYLIFG